MTHTTKHTPGPWEVVGSRICTVANDNERITLAKTEPGGAFAMSEQQDANAHLIAAAPAMYADAKQLCELVRDFMNDNRLYDGQVIQAISNLETALSQAEGCDK